MALGARSTSGGAQSGTSTSQKNPRAHKNKIGLPPPPPQNPNTPPHPKTRNFMDIGFFLAERAHFSRRP